MELFGAPFFYAPGGQLTLVDVPTPGHGKGEGPGGYKLFGDGKLAFWR